MIVTAVVRKPRRKLVQVFIDGEPALEIGRELAVERDVRPGRTFSQGELYALSDEQARRASLEAGLRLLSYRPRSERELRTRLARSGFRKAAIDITLARLRELGYLNDAEFARFYTETQQASRPRSRRIVRAELRSRGIAQEVAEAAIDGIDDEEAAYRAASRRLSSYRGLDYQPFRERLGSFLTRRGFSYDVALRIVERCWVELNDSPLEYIPSLPVSGRDGKGSFC